MFLDVVISHNDYVSNANVPKLKAFAITMERESLKLFLKLSM